MNLTYFYPKWEGNVENKNNTPVNIRFVAKTSDIRNFSENIRYDVKTSEVATLMLFNRPVCGQNSIITSEVATNPLLLQNCN